MFENLDDMLEKSKKPLDRRLPILMYGTTAIGSVIFLILGVSGRGYSTLFNLAVWAAMFLLSVTWLVTTLRSSAPITRRDFGVRCMIVFWLLWAHRLPHLFTGHM